jgi:hypothetical protein
MNTPLDVCTLPHYQQRSVCEKFLNGPGIVVEPAGGNRTTIINYIDDVSAGKVSAYRWKNAGKWRETTPYLADS